MTHETYGSISDHKILLMARERIVVLVFETSDDVQNSDIVLADVSGSRATKTSESCDTALTGLPESHVVFKNLNLIEIGCNGKGPLKMYIITDRRNN